MINLILFATLLAAPVDTGGCGSYRAAEWVLNANITSMLTAGGENVEFRANYGLVQQPSTATKAVVTDVSVCEPLLQYFVANVPDVASAYLASDGYQHAVMHFGDYQILLIVPNDPPGQMVGRRSYLFFFDLSGTHVTTVSF